MQLDFATLSDVVARRFKIDPARIAPDATFDDLGLDSLSQIELVMTLKKELGIEVTDEELEGMSSLSDILTFANEAA